MTIQILRNQEGWVGGGSQIGNFDFITLNSSDLLAIFDYDGGKVGWV